MSWLAFQDLEKKFLGDYMFELERDMRTLQLPDEVIREMVLRVQRNRQYITRPDLEEPVLEDEWPGVAQMIQ